MTSHAAILERACRYIDEAEELPTLEEVAGHVGLSPSHFQKLFTQALGVSPRHYGDAGRQKRLREALQSGEDISGAIYGAGYGSGSRVYEFAHRWLGMTPRAYRQGGKGHRIFYTVVRTPLGLLLIAATEKGLCSVRLGESAEHLITELQAEFPAAELQPKSEAMQHWVQALVDYLSGTQPWPLLPYDVKATAFQRRVWDHLRTIPAGQTANYAEVAEAIGMPNAARAVARACATNPVALVIPCHRILPKTGGTGGYRWQPERKKKLLSLEK